MNPFACLCGEVVFKRHPFICVSEDGTEMGATIKCASSDCQRVWMFQEGRWVVVSEPHVAPPVPPPVRT